jgi:pre-mRNA-processing factor SLU7
MNEFAWDAEQKGPQNTVHSNPTEGELLYKKQKQSEGTKSVVKKSILDKYGGSEYLESIPKELLLSQTEEYIEYSSSGDILKGEQKKLKSKYPEDMYFKDLHRLLHNHLSVWGSYWKDGKWGYKCCHSYLKNSYCGGINSLEAEESQSFLKPIGKGRGKSLVDIHIESKSTSKQQKPSFKRPGEGEFEVDQEKLKNAMAEEIKRKRIDDGTTKSFSGTLTEEEMEAYRLTKVRKDDPMAGYKDKFDK